MCPLGHSTTRMEVQIQASSKCKQSYCPRARHSTASVSAVYEWDVGDWSMNGMKYDRLLWKFMCMNTSTITLSWSETNSSTHIVPTTSYLLKTLHFRLFRHSVYGWNVRWLKYEAYDWLLWKFMCMNTTTTIIYLDQKLTHVHIFYLQLLICCCLFVTFHAIQALSVWALHFLFCNVK